MSIETNEHKTSVHSPRPAPLQRSLVEQSFLAVETLKLTYDVSMGSVGSRCFLCKKSKRTHKPILLQTHAPQIRHAPPPKKKHGLPPNTAVLMPLMLLLLPGISNCTSFTRAPNTSARASADPRLFLEGPPIILLLFVLLLFLLPPLASTDAATACAPSSSPSSSSSRRSAESRPVEIPLAFGRPKERGLGNGLLLSPLTSLSLSAAVADVGVGGPPEHELLRGVCGAPIALERSWSACGGVVSGEGGREGGKEREEGGVVVTCVGDISEETARRMHHARNKVIFANVFLNNIL